MQKEVIQPPGKKVLFISCSFMKKSFPDVLFCELEFIDFNIPPSYQGASRSLLMPFFALAQVKILSHTQHEVDGRGMAGRS